MRRFPVATRWKLQLLLILLGVGMVGGCAVNPVTGRPELALIPESEEIAIGDEQYLPSQQAQGGLYRVDPELTDYVRKVGQRIARVSDRRLPYEFVVLNNSVPNAWALPGGKLAVNRGLLLELDNEAELAAVLGHEIVHAAARHGANAMQRGMLLQGMLIATALSTADSEYSNYIVGGAQLGAQLVSRRYSRTDELEADRYGIRYMARAGYDPQAAVALQQTFVKLSEGNNRSWLEGLFSSHPPSEERVRANQKTAAELPGGGELGRERYQQKIAYLASKKGAYAAFDQATTLANQNHLQEALARVDHAIQIEPGEPRFYGLKGDIFLAEKRYVPATEQYDSALGMDPDYYEYYLGRGLAGSRLGRASQAREDLKHSNELLPTAVATNELGQLSLASGDIREAKQYFQAAMSASGSIGERAAAAFVKLDLPENPNKYIEVQPSVSRDGRMFALVTNHSELTVGDLEIEFRATVNGGPVRRLVRLGPLAPGQQGAALAGWQFGPTDVVEGVSAAVTSARVE